MEKLGGRAERVLGVDHDDPAVADLALGLDEGAHVGLDLEDLVREREEQLQVVESLEQVFDLPDGVEVGIAPREGREGAAVQAQGGAGMPDPALLPGLLAEEAVAAAAGGGGEPRRAHPDEVGALLGEPEERPPGGVVVDVGLVGIVRADVEAADLVEAYGGPVHGPAGEGGHEAVAPGHHLGAEFPS